MQSHSLGNRSVLKELSCPNCKSPLGQHTPEAQTLVCAKCGSYVGIGEEEARLLAKGGKFPAPPVPVKIGSRFALDNTEYFVLGRVMYKGWDPEDKADYWTWDEWQLGAADGRLLWLSYDTEDGFVLFKKIPIREEFNIHRSAAIPVGKGRQARVVERYPAIMVGAEGELTFRAQRGDRVQMIEGDAGPLKYSMQATDEEIELYEGRPVPAEAVAHAFGDSAWLRRIQSRQYNKRTRQLVGVVCLLFGLISLLIAAVVSQTGIPILDTQITVDPSNPIALLPIEFDTAGRPAIIRTELLSSIPVNSYVDVDVSVIAPNVAETVIYSQEFWHETGVEDGESWEESEHNTGDMFVPYQPGTHQIEVALDNMQSPLDIHVEVVKDHVVPGWFLGYGVIVGGIGLLLLFNSGGISPKVMLIIAIPIIILVIIIAAGVELGDLVSLIFDILSEA